MLTSNYKIILINGNNEDQKDIPLYVNKFGEGFSGNYTSKEFKLSNDEIIKTYKIFINNYNLNY